MAKKNVALSAYKAGLNAKRAGKRRKPKFTIPLAIVAGFIPGGVRLWNHRHSVEDFSNEASRIYLGYTPWNGTWNLSLAMLGTGPIIGGMLVHKFVGGMLGVNKLLSRTRLPIRL